MNTKEWKCLILIIFTFIAACIETDIYLPAFPDMMKYFSTPEVQIQQLLTWNFFGICISGPFYGPISDSYGRKKPLVVALGIFLFGSIITLFAQDFSIMLIGRLFQGIGSGGCFTLGTAIIFDSFRKEKAIYAVNQLNAIIPCIMAIAPMLGGYLNVKWGFRSNFIAIAIFVAISFIVCAFYLRESLPKEKMRPIRMKKVFADFGSAFRSLAFWQMTVIVSLSFAGYLVFVSTSSVLFVMELGVSQAKFPLYQGSMLGSWVVASLLNSTVTAKYGANKVKKFGMVFVFLGIISLIAVSFLAPKDPVLLTACMILYTFGSSWMMAVYFAEGMEILPEIKGVTASLLNSGRLLLTAIVVGVVSSLYNGTVYPLVYTVIVVALLALLTVYFYEKNKLVKV